MNEKLTNKLSELGYVSTFSDGGTDFYSKKTTVGAPVDGDGNHVYVYVEIGPDGQCSISTDAFTPFGHVKIDYQGIDPDFFARNLKTLERQIVYAWRELAD